MIAGAGDRAGGRGPALEADHADVAVVTTALTALTTAWPSIICRRESTGPSSKTTCARQARSHMWTRIIEWEKVKRK